mmetsp:Transcript_11858/g.28347  ORF Transcript_11858/g.28347 Transcript_11858/m.28347 type:complete len:623 (+) Transcript_11858:114-1982(+)
MRFGLWNFLVLVILVWGLSIVLYMYTLPSHDEKHLINAMKGSAKAPNRQNQLQNANANHGNPPPIALATVNNPPSRKSQPWTPAPHIPVEPPLAPPQPETVVEDPNSIPNNDMVVSGGKLAEEHHLAQHALPLPHPTETELPKPATPAGPPSLHNPTAVHEPAAPAASVVGAHAAPAEPAPPSDKFTPETTAIVVLTCKRVNYLEETMRELLKLPDVEKYHVFISQDGHDDKVATFGKKTEREFPFVHLINNDMRQDHRHQKDQASMFYIADHYKFAMTAVFERMEGITHAILLEEDIIVSPDFLRFFAAAAPILDQDATLMCISSWNDNGYKHLDLDAKRLMRSRFFPGLGWMLRRQLWVEELKHKWPMSAWDHWMRTSTQHKGRDCIIPELSRNHNIGAVGATVSQNAFEAKLKNIAHNADPAVLFGDLSYLRKDRYLEWMRQQLADATPVASISTHLERGRTYRLGFVREAWAKIAEGLGIYTSNWPRGAFEHVTQLHKGGATLLLYDRRLSTIAPEAERIKPPPSLQMLAAPQGVNCDEHCSTKSLRCDKAWFDFVNDCSYLHANFPCQRGCGYEVGEDIPNFVSDQKHPMSGFCLITDAIPTCHNKHPSTSRLCACA